jgi:uncharacterized protein (DUF433 family)
MRTGLLAGLRSDSYQLTERQMTATREPIERTEHPHVVKSADVLSGEPTVDGTRLAVRHVLIRYRDLGETPEVIADHFGLTLAQVLDALSYCYDHPDEIAYHEERHKIRNIMRKHGLLIVGGRLDRPAEPEAIEVPPDTPIYTWETLPPQLDDA